MLKKRFTTLFLALVMVLSLSGQAIASEDAESPNSESIEAQFIDSDGIAVSAIVPTKSKAIVIVPGTLGSKLLSSTGSQYWPPNTYVDDIPLMKGRLACNTSGVSEKVIKVYAPSSTEYGSTDTYKTLVQTLNNTYKSSYDVWFFSYDWRLDVKTAAYSLKNALSEYSEVILVCHSMGGIVASAYARMLADQNISTPTITKMITIGTPYTGSAKAVHVMETGELVEVGNGYQLKGSIKALAPNYTSVYQLLPSKNYSTPYLSVDGISKNHTQAVSYLKGLSWASSGGNAKPLWSDVDMLYNMLWRNGTHIANNTSLLTTYKLYGTGKDTISRANYTSSGAYGVPTYNNQGDGTVLSASATNNSSTRTYKFNGVGHTDLVKNSNVINTVIQIIGGTSTYAANNEDSFDKTEETNARGWLTNADGKRINVVLDNLNEYSISFNGLTVFEDDNAELYAADASGSYNVGHRWSLGDGRNMLILYDGNYQIDVSPESSATIEIEYLDKGYYLHKESYIVDGLATFELSDFSAPEISAYLSANQAIATCDNNDKNTTTLSPEMVWTKEEITLLNMD